MVSVFWDGKGIIYIDYLEKGKTINSEYYIALLERLKTEVAKKRPHLARKKIPFHQDNAPCHKSLKTMAKLYELGFELLQHPLYFPDLTLSDYCLFAQLKKWLVGRKVLFQRGDHRIWDVFWRSRQIILQKRYWNVRKTLDWLHHSSRELCWWIKTICGKKCFFLHLPRNLLTDALT